MEDPTITLPLRKRARVEIIPLIDVIFFLLATFVLFTLSLNRIQSVPVELPAGGDKVPTDLLKLQVSDQGNVYFNGELVDLTEVPARLDLWSRGATDPKVLITGDNQARWETTIKVLDFVRQAHIAKVSMETHTRPTGR